MADGLVQAVEDWDVGEVAVEREEDQRHRLEDEQGLGGVDPYPIRRLGGDGVLADDDYEVGDRANGKEGGVAEEGEVANNAQRQLHHTSVQGDERPAAAGQGKVGSGAVAAGREQAVRWSEQREELIADDVEKRGADAEKVDVDRHLQEFSARRGQARRKHAPDHRLVGQTAAQRRARCNNVKAASQQRRTAYDDNCADRNAATPHAKRKREHACAYRTVCDHHRGGANREPR